MRDIHQTSQMYPIDVARKVAQPCYLKPHHSSRDITQATDLYAPHLLGLIGQTPNLHAIVVPAYHIAQATYHDTFRVLGRSIPQTTYLHAVIGTARGVREPCDSHTATHVTHMIAESGNLQAIGLLAHHVAQCAQCKTLPVV